MKITDIKIRKTETEGKMVGIVSVTFDDQLVVHDIKIIKTEEKLFLAMPAKRLPDGRYRDIVHPISAELRAEIEHEVLEKNSQI